MRPLAVLGSSVLVASASACSGATEQDVFSSSSSSSGASSSSSASSSGGSSTSSSGSSSSSGAASSSDAGSSGTSGTCPSESEPNDGPRNANALVDSMCGVLSPGSELDYVTFELAPGTKTMSFTFKGDIVMRVSVEGQSAVEISPTKNPPIPFVIGKPYFVQIRALDEDAAAVDWRVNVNRT